MEVLVSIVLPILLVYLALVATMRAVLPRPVANIVHAIFVIHAFSLLLRAIRAVVFSPFRLMRCLMSLEGANRRHPRRRRHRHARRRYRAY